MELGKEEKDKLIEVLESHDIPRVKLALSIIDLSSDSISEFIPILCCIRHHLNRLRADGDKRYHAAYEEVRAFMNKYEAIDKLYNSNHFINEENEYLISKGMDVRS